MFSVEFPDSILSTCLLSVVILVVFSPVLFKGIYFLKQFYTCKVIIRSFLKKQKAKLQPCADLQRTDLTPIDVGMIPSPTEYEQEKPRIQSFTLHDGIHFAGISSEGHLVDICINRIKEDMASVWVYLQLSDGTLYKLPCSDTRRAFIANDSTFSSSGLQIRCLSALRKWRISFNGVLQEFKSNAGQSDKMIHTRFSFVWLAMSGVHEKNISYTDNVLADAFNSAGRSVSEEDLKRLFDLQNVYEQWGQMMGTIRFSGETEKELYFWSLRSRISDYPVWDEKSTCAKFYMYFMDGIPLKVESVSIENFVSNLQNGFSVSTYGGIRPISCFDFKIGGLKDKEMKLKCIFGGSQKNINICFTQGVTTFYTGPELQFKVQLRPFRVRMNESDEGYGILHHTVMSTSEEREKFKYPLLLLKDPGFSSCEKSVLRLEDENCRSAWIAGGKGSSLALLTELSKKSNEFVVPKGLIISTKAFKEHLGSNKAVQEAVQRLKDVACKVLPGDLKAECTKCKEAFVSTQVSESLKNEIKKTLENIYGSLENVRFSIRSSAFGEDSEDLSAAGQMLTILGVRSLENIFKAVIECWASKFGFEAVQYARQNGQSILSPMAVVIQEMVPSDFSGVMFTVDPVTGDPTHPYITANFGLGETVVSALADPDTIVLEREMHQTLKIFKKEIGSKMTQAFMNAEDGVEQKKYDGKFENACLSDEWALKIGEIGVLIESCFCSPRDIEWAVHKDQLYLLQARPITTLHNETDFELIHDQDTPVRSVNDFWTRANTGEVFLGATSPLGISLVVSGMDIFAHRGHVLRERRQNEFCPYFFHILPVTHRQIALNIIDTLFKANEEKMTAVQKAFEIALFGRSVITEEMHEAGVRKYGYATRTKKYLGLLFIPVISRSIPKEIVKLSKELEKYSVPLETYTSAQEAWNGTLGQMNFCSKAFNVHGMATFLSSYYNMMLMTILSKNKKEWDTELYCDFSTLLSSCSGVESADVPESLQELAHTIAVNLGDTFSTIPSDAAHDLLKSDGGESGLLFKKFIEKHGHRCVKEFDISSKSWGMQPESLIPTLQNMVKASSHSKISPKQVPDSDTILSQIKTPLSGFNKQLLKFFLQRSRKFVCEREKTKSMLIKIVDWLRKSCYLLGDLMVKEGMLPDAELVFYLTSEEIQEILGSQKPGLVPKAVRRKRLHPQLNELKLPEIMKGIPRPIQIQQDFSNYAASFTLKGTPVYQGTVKAKAVVVLTLEEASKIESGDILITHATDIGWSPYFPLLSGVVTVLGGLISHGAVVAREFGLPCVVGVQNATALFKSGDMVILNGTDGTITKIADEERK